MPWKRSAIYIDIGRVNILQSPAPRPPPPSPRILLSSSHFTLHYYAANAGGEANKRINLNQFVHGYRYRDKCTPRRMAEGEIVPWQMSRGAARSSVWCKDAPTLSITIRMAIRNAEFIATTIKLYTFPLVERNAVFVWCFSRFFLRFFVSVVLVLCMETWGLFRYESRVRVSCRIRMGIWNIFGIEWCSGRYFLERE